MAAAGVDYGARVTRGRNRTDEGVLATMDLLIKAGANVNAKANLGQAATALMGAAFNGNVELTRLLLAGGAAVDAVSADRSGTVKNGAVLFGNVTAVHLATSSGNVDVLKMLLDAGAAVDPRDVRGMTALMWAVGTDRSEPRIVRMLLDRGADPLAQSGIGESTLDWARKFNNPSVLGALKLQPVPTTQEKFTATDRPATPREAVDWFRANYAWKVKR